MAVRTASTPRVRDRESTLRVTPVTGMKAALIVTVQVSVYPPSTVVTVMVAVPGATPVTIPLLTVATLLLLVDQVTALLVASEGRTV